MGSYVPGRDPEDYDPPVIWIHNGVDRSPAGSFGLPAINGARSRAP